VFLQAPDQLKDQLRRNLQCLDDYPPTRQVLQHAMILLEVSEDWREYLVYLEEEFSRIVSTETCKQELD
jgi:hypothetical protein